MGKLREVRHKVDFCVVGGGMAGFTAALAAARHGARVALMHDRPVLGGNASSECRVHICGADRHGWIPNMRETGILEEMRLENQRRNPDWNFSTWDMLLHEKLMLEPKVTVLLNCSCLAAEKKGALIKSVRGWQLTTQTYHTVEAKVFADCSGDGILAPLTGAASRRGREARREYGESISPLKADKKTMGMTCLFQARQHKTPQPFEPPAWAEKFDECSDLPGRGNHTLWYNMGYWWVELGGEDDEIHDTERLRDELLAITLGVWDHLKNRCERKQEAENWALEWLQFLPAKRESRRFIGDHVLSQPDVEAEGKFEDIVAYGGWTMDDHHPAGFRSVKLHAPPTIFHQAPSPFGIPYRSLCSRNIKNLMFAGRNASCTHAAMSSTRVMGTACSMGQAVGVAAAMAARKKTTPRGVGKRIDELQQKLLRDDCYIPWVGQRFSRLTTAAELRASRGDPAPLRDGVNRPVGEDGHGWPCRRGDHVSYILPRAAMVNEVSLVMDSALDKDIAMSLHPRGGRPMPVRGVPRVLPRAFRIQGLKGGKWKTIAAIEDNCQRFLRIPLGKKLSGVRFLLDATWGAKATRLHAFYLD